MTLLAHWRDQNWDILDKNWNLLSTKYKYSSEIPLSWIETLENTPIPSPESPIISQEMEHWEYAAYVADIWWVKLPTDESKMSVKRQNIKYDWRLVTHFPLSGKTGYLNRNGSWVAPPEWEEGTILREKVAIYGLRIVDFSSRKSGILKIDGSWYTDKKTSKKSFHKTEIDETNNVRYQAEKWSLLTYIDPNQINTVEAEVVLETVKKVSWNVASIFQGQKRVSSS